MRLSWNVIGVIFILMFFTFGIKTHLNNKHSNSFDLEWGSPTFSNTEKTRLFFIKSDACWQDAIIKSNNTDFYMNNKYLSRSEYAYQKCMGE
jgi:flagellar assembly factor FliW